MTYHIEHKSDDGSWTVYSDSLGKKIQFLSLEAANMVAADLAGCNYLNKVWIICDWKIVGSNGFSVCI